MKQNLLRYLIMCILILLNIKVNAQAPSNLSAYVISKSDITLFWNDNSTNETGFNLEISTDNVTWTVTRNPSANATGQSASGLTAGTLYYFRICAVVGGVNTAYSNVVSATTFANTGTAPTAPSALTLTASGSNVINLSWTDNSTNETDFKIERSTNGTTYILISTVGPNTTSYSNTVAAGSTYYYRVRAGNIYGTSAYTTAVNVNMPTGSALTDITNAANGIITAQYTAASGSTSETVTNFIDNDVNTKYRISNPSNWIKFECPRTYVATKYTITSANDWMERDPSGWTLEGSLDGTTWTTLDVRTNLLFTSRIQTQEYSFTNTAEHLYYRLTISGTKGSPDMQMMEWQIWGVQGTGTPPSAAPTNLIATPASSNTINLSWTDNSTNETGYSVYKSEDGINYTLITTLAANTSTYADANLSASTPFAYKVRALNAAGFSAFAGPVFATTQSPVLAPDITDNVGGVLTDKYADGGSKNTIDNSLNSRYYANYNNTWIRFQATASAVVTAYAVSTGTDNASVDPKNWTFEGSNDGTTWTVLNTQTNVAFSSRQSTKTYTFTNSTSYTYYRLNVTANNGNATGTAIAEWQIFGTGGGIPGTTAPTAPTGLTATAVSGDQIIVTWTDNVSNETIYRIEWSLDGVTWEYKNLVASSTKFIHHDLTDLTTYYYRLRAENAGGNSAYTTVVSAKSLDNTFPDTWQEHWLEHNQLLTKFWANENTAIYFDPDVNPQVTWLNQIVSDAWEYTKKSYGSFSSTKLYANFHQDKYGGGNPSSFFDATRDYRNAICVGKNGDWTSTMGTASNWNLDATIHEIGHIVEGGSKGVHNSPAFPLWGDSKWMEIYQYDLYTKLGWTAEASRWYTQCMNTTDTYPRAGTQWFKNWWYPIYTQYGETEVLNRFFTLLQLYFPQRNGDYTRNLNYGEFVHFWSAAACTNLKAQATTAFGWPDSWEIQFRQAQIDFPFTYNCPNLVVNNITKTYGDAPFTLVASSNSTGAITYAITSGQKYASITPNGQVTIKGAGAVTIHVVQVAEAGLGLGTANITLTINKAPLSITAVNKTKTYGLANPALTMSYTGFVNGENSSVLTTQPSIATTAVTTSNVGTYPITLSGGSATNYVITLVNGTLTVNKAVLTITADNKSKIYGSANPALTMTYSGFVNGETSTVLTTLPTLSTTTVTGSNAGAYPITLSGGSAGNYAITLVNGTLTINKAALTITASNKSKVYGTLNPVLTMTYSGFVNGETSSALTAQPVISTTAVTGSNVGNYPITLSGGSTANYSITLVNGTLTITQATPTLTYSGPLSGTQGSNITLSVTSNSSGSISYAVANGTGVASVSGTTLNLTLVGDVTLTVNLAATTNYTGASIQQVITINTIPNQDPVIVFNDINKTFGEPDFTVSASSNSGGTFTYAIVSGSQYATITSNGLVSLIGSGTVIIQASQAAITGFNPGTKTATLTIDKSNGVGYIYTGPTSGNVGDVIVLSASSVSTGAITYQLLGGGTGSASITGNQLTLNSSGTVSIQINIAADANFNAQSITQVITINTVTDVNSTKFMNEQLKVFPNPVHDIVNIQLDIPDMQEGSIELCDINGRVLRVIEKGQIGNQAQYSVSIADLSAGVYVIKFVSENGFLGQYKFVKSNY